MPDNTVRIEDNPDLTDLTIGAVADASQLQIRNNPKLSNLDRISSGFTATRFDIFEPDNRGFSRAYLITFLNRIWLTHVCETVTGVFQGCQHNPPWQ